MSGKRDISDDPRARRKLLGVFLGAGILVGAPGLLLTSEPYWLLLGLIAGVFAVFGALALLYDPEGFGTD